MNTIKVNKDLLVSPEGLFHAVCFVFTYLIGPCGSFRQVFMALGSTQPVTEMSTRSISWG